MLETDVYRSYLKDEFERRKRRNSSYSLRAYARDLALPSSKLSQYLSGDCGISVKKATEIAKQLRLNSAESELFVCSAQASHARDALSRKAAGERLAVLKQNTFSEINMNKFSLIRDWYHVAILELLEVESFEPDVHWIARTLQIEVQLVCEALTRLEQLGLIDMSQHPWRQTEVDFETPPNISSRAIREYHQQMLRLMETRLEDIPIEHRELGSIVFAVDTELVGEYKNLLRKFQKDITSLTRRSQKKNAVYALNYQLMPLDKGEQE